MRRVSIIFLLILSLFFTGLSFGQNDADGVDEQKVEEIKKRISSKVSSLKLDAIDVQTGYLEAVEQDKGILRLKNDNSTVDIYLDDEITNFYEIRKNSPESLPKDEIEPGDYLVVYGNKIEDKLQAVNIFRQDKEEVISGTVMEVREDDDSLLVIDDIGEQIIVRTGRRTNMLILQEDQEDFEFVKTRFSKIKENDKIIFSFFSTAEADLEDVFSQELLLIPQELLEKLRADKN